MIQTADASGGWMPSWECNQPPASLDIGLRVYDGAKIVHLAVQPTGTTPMSPLRISKGGVTYGLLLVDPAAPNASKFKIGTAQGIKAVARL